MKSPEDAVNALRDRTPRLGDVTNQRFGFVLLSVERTVTYLGNHNLICVFSCTSLYCRCGISLQLSQTADGRAVSMLVDPHAGSSGLAVKRENLRE